MFVEIFYVISLLSVTPHNPSFNLDVCEFGEYIGTPVLTKEDFFNCSIKIGEEYWTAIEGYINMFGYSVCYCLMLDFLLVCSLHNFVHKACA